MKQALLIIDIQNDYFPGGAMALVGSQQAGQQAQKLLHAFRQKSSPIIHIQHVAVKAGATFFIPDTEGVKIHECVSPLAGEVVIQKHFPNSFRATLLLEHLQKSGITDLVIAGMMTHMCVDTTTRAAHDFGFNCLLAHDACATKDLTFGDVTASAAQVQAAYMGALSGSFAQVLPAQELCLV